VKVGEKVLLPEYGGTKIVLEDKVGFPTPRGPGTPAVGAAWGKRRAANAAVGALVAAAESNTAVVGKQPDTQPLRPVLTFCLSAGLLPV